MASSHSYTITIENNKTESQGVKYLLASSPRFINPSKESRKIILKTLKLSKKFSRAFDLIIVKGHTNKEKEINLKTPRNITLVELKTTQDYLPENPKGFFFGVTANELRLAKKLGTRYYFCFASLHTKSKSFVLLTRKKLEKLI